MSTQFTTVVATAIPAAVAVIIAIVTWTPTSLRKTERLTGIASKMSPSSERTLVEDLRDDLVVAWALNQMAPTYPAHRAWSFVLFVIGGFVEVIWLLAGIVTHNAWWTWAIYAIGLVLVIAGAVIWGIAMQNRRAWMRRQREERWIRQPVHSKLLGAMSVKTSDRRSGLGRRSPSPAADRERQIEC